MTARIAAQPELAAGLSELEARFAGRDASLQFVRKLSGFSLPSQANRAALDVAVQEVAASARRLIASLVTTAEPRDREVEAAKAKARSALRFGLPGGPT